ncbi:alpha/beta hydrolase [uncultured Eubacterium sp.]|uniref:alpha/beta hydrolase n=1 Tax=uncultured Eubacterium sp. TaxID=165185 RepID=UPI0025963E1F|nr:alpha/beta hydrolase [uncultured Eubacterium sp.]
MSEKIYEKIRREYGTSDRERDKNEKTPDDIERFDDIRYGDDAFFNVLDVYRPRNCHGKKLPVIVSVHGGAFVYGSKEVYQYYCMKLAQRGYAVVNFSYRLAPEFKFPAALYDMKEVYEWILYNKDEYEFDIENTFAVGDSAGANLLGIYAGIASSEVASKEFEIVHPSEVKIKGIALNCGKFVLEKFDELNEDKLYECIFEDGGTRAEFDKANVVRYVTSNYPNTFVMTCFGDFLKEQPKYLVPKLEEEKVNFEYRIYGDDDNPLWHVFHCHPTLKEAVICNDDECDFFRKCMD